MLLVAQAISCWMIMNNESQGSGRKQAYHHLEIYFPDVYQEELKKSTKDC
jgi:hypothetical protein